MLHVGKGRGMGHINRRPAGSSSGGTALSASTITRTTGATTYPPQVDFTRPIDWVDGIKAVMQWSTDYTFATGVSETSSPQTITAAVTSYNFGLSAIVSGSYFMRMGAWQGTRPGALNWSNILNVGDVTAPTISTSTSQTGSQGVSGAVTLTASEGVTWAITGGADAASFTITQLTATTASLAWGSLTAAAYAVQVTATDYAGNASSPWNGTVTITDAQQAWTSTTGANKNTSSVTSGTHNEIVTFGSSNIGIRALNAIVPDAFHFEVTINTISTTAAQGLLIGLDNGSQSFSSALGGFLRDILGANLVEIEDPTNGESTWTAAIFCKDLAYGAVITLDADPWANGDVVAIEGKRSTGEFKVYRVRSGTATLKGSATIDTFTTCYPVAMTAETGVALTLNIGWSAFAMTPTSGYTAAKG